MIKRESAAEYCERHGIPSQSTKDDVQYALQLVYLSLGVLPENIQPHDPLLHLPSVKTKKQLTAYNGSEEFLHYLCKMWRYELNEAVYAKHWRDTTFNGVLLAIAAWKEKLAIKSKWVETPWQHFLRMATPEKHIDKVLKSRLFLRDYKPNAYGGLKLGHGDPFVGTRRELGAFYLLHIASRQPLADDAYATKFGLSIDLSILSCTLECIAEYSAEPMIPELLCPSDELYNDWIAEEIWGIIGKRLPQSTRYRLSRRPEQLGESDDSPLLQYLSVYKFVRQVTASLVENE